MHTRTVVAFAFASIASLCLSAFSFQVDHTFSVFESHLRADFETMIAQATSPEFEQLQSRHQSIIRKGYADVLFDQLRQDSLSAILSFLKYRLHKLFSLPHTLLVKVIPMPQQRISVPIIYDYPNGYLVIESGQNKIYRRINNDLPPDPWEKTKP